tara:strand:- start:1371 stop:2822 length:1452 start_codon:yes stop_codon:yes gene_type:complete
MVNSQSNNGLSEEDHLLLEGTFTRILDYLASNSNREVPLATIHSAIDLYTEMDLSISDGGVDAESLLSDIDAYLQHSVKTSHPHFMNPFWGGPPVSSLVGEFISALTNTSMYTFEIAPVATLIEQEMIQLMSKFAGYDNGEGTFTSGGSNGNLMGLLCARDHKFPDAKFSGFTGTPVAFVSVESHYSVEVAANTLGMGTDNLVAVESDDQGRMNVADLQAKISEQKAAGKTPFCVIATSGTTVKGAFDPLPEIADICEREEIWLHVDAAWGGAALLSPTTRNLVQGIERTHSLCWDPHKMMGMPISCSVFLVNQSGILKDVCSHSSSAHYLLHKKNAEFDMGRMSLQCARRVDALKLWLTWRSVGNQGWAEKIENYMSLAAYLTKQVKQEPTLELVLEPEFTNVCVRYAGHNLSSQSQDDITNQIRTEMFERGKFMVTKALIDHRPILRPVIANPAVDQKSLDKFISEITTIGARMEAVLPQK